MDAKKLLEITSQEGITDIPIIYIVRIIVALENQGLLISNEQKPSGRKRRGK